MRYIDTTIGMRPNAVLLSQVSPDIDGIIRIIRVDPNISLPLSLISAIDKNSRQTIIGMVMHLNEAITRAG